MANLRPQAIKRIQSRLVLEAVVKAENIEATQEEVDAEIEKMASMYQMEVDKVKELLGENEMKSIAQDVAVQKAIDLVTEAAKETKAKKTTKKAAEKAEDGEEKPKKTTRKTTKKAETETAEATEEKPKRTRKTTKKAEAETTEE